MQPFYTFSPYEHDVLFSALQEIKENPYCNYDAFSLDIANLVETNAVPSFFVDICAQIKHDRDTGLSNVHVLRNCPIDPDVPYLNSDDPLNDKYEKKQTFIGEAFLELFARLMQNPLLAYGSRHNGDFFTDVVAINRYSGKLTGFSDSELVYHNDRTAHAVRADFISLLGLRCPEDDLIVTGFIDGKHLLEHLSDSDQRILREPYFITQFDVFSRETNQRQIQSEPHPILENDHSFRFLDTMTGVTPDGPIEARDALIAMKNALSRTTRVRHRILTGDLLVFANQDGLHNREKIEVNDPEQARTRWLLKTYAFRDRQAANQHSDHWLNGTYGRVAD